MIIIIIQNQGYKNKRKVIIKENYQELNQINYQDLVKQVKIISN